MRVEKDRLDGGGEGGLLGGEELADAGFGDVEHLGELGAGVGVFFGGGLGFDEAAAGEHDDVHVDGGAGVFFVAEVEEDVAVDDADGGGGDHLGEGCDLEGSGDDELVEGDGEGDGGSGDGGGAGSAVGLEDVAVEDDGAFAEGFHIDYGAEGAADEALDLVGAAAYFAAFGLACGAGEGGAGEHAVLGGDPAAAGVAEPAGDALLDGGVAEDAGVAGLDEDGALGGGDVAGGDAEGAELVGGAGVGAEELGNGHQAIIVCGGDARCVRLFENEDLVSTHAAQSKRASEACSSVASSRRDSVYRISVLFESFDGGFRILESTREDAYLCAARCCYAYELWDCSCLCGDWLSGV